MAGLALIEGCLGSRYVGGHVQSLVSAVFRARLERHAR